MRGQILERDVFAARQAPKFEGPIIHLEVVRIDVPRPESYARRVYGKLKMLRAPARLLPGHLLYLVQARHVIIHGKTPASSTAACRLVLQFAQKNLPRQFLKLGCGPGSFGTRLGLLHVGKVQFVS